MKRKEILEFFSNITGGLIAIDMEQRIVLWNEDANALLGFNSQEVQGKFCYDAISFNDGLGRPICKKDCLVMKMVMRNKPVPTRNMWALTKDGQRICLNTNTISVPLEWRKGIVLVHLFRDITPQKKIEYILQRPQSSPSMLSLGQGARAKKSLSYFPVWANLSSREREILRLLACGASTNIIADTLAISITTVRNHIQNILAKLNVHSRIQAVALVLKKGLSLG